LRPRISFASLQRQRIFMPFIVVALISVCLVSASAQNSITQSKSAQFERVKAEMQARLEPLQKDGTRKLSKQYRRWEWFWESRLMEDGSFPTTQLYLQEIQRVENRKKDADVQATPTWKELGPTAPNMPNELPGWNGIGRVSVVETFATDPNLVLLGSAQGGIWKSSNGGVNWTAVNIPGYPIFSVSDLTVAPSNENIVYVATGDVDATVPSEVSGFPSFSYGVLKSTDRGLTWKSTGLTIAPESNNLISALWVDPSNPDVVIAATYIGIMKSTDGGATWQVKSTALQFRDIIQNPSNKSIMYSSTFSISGSARFYKSEDAGETWEPVMTLSNVSRIKIAVSPAKPNLVMFAAASSSDGSLDGVYKSLNNGSSFLKMGITTNVSGTTNLLGWSSPINGSNTGGQGWYDLAFEISPTNSSQIFIGGINIWRSSNEGTNWVLSAHWTGAGGAPWVHADIHWLKYQKSQNKLFACSDGGIARSTDNGVSWRDVSEGLKIQQYYGLASSNVNTSLTMAGAQDNGTALTRNGSNYSHVLDGDGMACAIDKINPQVVYASQYNGRFYRSLNQGSSFSQMSNEGQRGDRAAWVAPIACDPKNTSTVYIGYTGLYKSTNAGSSWVKLGTLPATTMRCIAVAPSNPNYIYVGYNGAMYVSTNGGSTFTMQNGIGGFVMDIEVHPSNPERVWVTFGAFSPSQKIIEINKGVITNITGFGLPNVPCNTVAFQPGVLNRLFVGTDVGVFFKDDASTTWAPYGKGMPSTVVSDMNFISTTNVLRVATYGRGIWEIDAVQCQATKPTVSVIGQSKVCYGDSITIEAQDGFDTYSWNNGASTRSIVLKDVSQSGEYTVSVQDNNGCHASSNSVTVSVLRIPVKPNITVKSDTLRSSALGGITIFQWFKKNGALVEIPGATDREYKVLQNGEYVVRIGNDDGCFTFSDPVAITDINVGVDEDLNAGYQMLASPNPFDAELTVNLPRVSGGRIEVINLRGEVVYSMTIEGGVRLARIPTSQLSAATYLVRLCVDGAVYTAIAIKQ